MLCDVIFKSRHHDMAWLCVNCYMCYVIRFCYISFYYYLLHVGTFCGECFCCDQCSNIARVIFSIWWSIVWSIKTNFLFYVLYALIARILFSACWELLWWIKINLVWRWQMQWLQEYYFMYVGTLCDVSKRIFFLSIVCSDGKNTVFCMLNIVWCIKTNFLFKYCMQWLQEYCFIPVGTFSDESKQN